MRRIALDLHDGPMQSIAAARLQAESAISQAIDPGFTQTFQALCEQLDIALAELHELAVGLRPSALDAADLGEMLHQHVADRANGSGLVVHLQIADDLPRLSASAQIALFRIVQEALSNTLGHSGASHAEVSLRHDDGHVVCEVADDGRGFDPDAVHPGERRGLGLGGMRERAQLLGGEIDVRSRPGQGTTIVARIPIWN